MTGVVWKEFVWGAIAGAFGEGMMHPVDTVKTHIQSQGILSGCQVVLNSTRYFLFYTLHFFFSNSS